MTPTRPTNLGPFASQDELDHAMRALADYPDREQDERQCSDWPPAALPDDRRSAAQVRCDLLTREKLPPGLTKATPAWHHWHDMRATVGMVSASATSPKSAMKLAQGALAAPRLRVFSASDLEAVSNGQVATQLIQFWLRVGRIVPLDKLPGEETSQYYRWCEECGR